MQPKPERDPASPETEIYYASRLRATISLVLGAGAVALSLLFFLRSDQAHGAVASGLGGFCLLMGGYAVVFELRSLLNPKSHSLRIGPEGLTLTNAGRPVVYAWEDVSNFIVSDARSWRDESKDSPIESPQVTFEARGKTKRIVIDELYGWRAQDLAAHLHYAKRKYLKKAKAAEKDKS